MHRLHIAAVLGLLVLVGNGCAELASEEVPQDQTPDVVVETQDTNTDPMTDDEKDAVVTNFDECVEVTGIVLESYPEQCQYNGEMFTNERQVLEPIPEPEPTPAPAPTPAPTPQGIVLSGSASESGISLSWTMNGVNADKGLKVVKSLEANPTYGEDTSVYFEDGSTRSYEVAIADGKTYHFRVCTYTGDGCDNYSNNVAITAVMHEGTTPKKEEHNNNEVTTAEPSVSSIALSGAGGNAIAWQTTGDASWGYKITYSLTPRPEYPSRDEGDQWIFVWDPQASGWELEPFAGEGKYYIRVCEYIGDACGVYSNEISLTLFE